MAATITPERALATEDACLDGFVRGIDQSLELLVETEGVEDPARLICVQLELEVGAQLATRREESEYGDGDGESLVHMPPFRQLYVLSARSPHRLLTCCPRLRT